MAHTNSTPNYNLPQFLGTDKPAWLTDINNAMSDIDAAIAAAKTTADSADAAVSAIGITVGNHTSQLSTLSGAVTSQGNTLNTVTALIGNGVPTTTDQTIIGAINELAAIVEAGEVSVTADGVKSNADLLNEIRAAADTTKIGANSKIIIGSSVSNFVQSGTNGYDFSHFVVLPNNTIAGISVRLKSGASSYLSSSTAASATSFADASASVPTVGTVFKLVY